MRCTRLVALAGLPKTVRVLNVIGCTSLESLAGMPTSVESLWVGECSQLKLQSLQDLPSDLIKLNNLDVRGIKSLASITGCPPSVEKLDASNSPLLVTLQDQREAKFLT